jgi:predicted permease
VGEIFATVAPVFLCAGVGFAWSRAGRPFDRPAVTALNIELAAPCLVFSRLVTLELDPAAMGQIALATVLALAGFSALGALILRALGLPAHTWLSPLVFVNAGNMGLPVCLFAFGEDGLPLAIAFFAVCAVANFTLAPPLWSGRFDGLELARTPVIWATLLAVGVLALGIHVPLWLLRSATVLGDLAIPLMLLALGVSLAELRVVRVRRALGLAGLRLALGVGVGLAVAAALRLEGTVRGVFLLQAAMPAAVFNHLFAQRYGRSPDEVAGVVVVSTLLAFVTLPVMLALLGVPR